FAGRCSEGRFYERTLIAYHGRFLCGMRFELENLEGGKSDFAQVYQPADINPVDERISLTEPATVTGKVRLTDNEVFVNGHVDTRAQVECDRCLQPVE